MRFLTILLMGLALGLSVYAQKHAERPLREPAELFGDLQGTLWVEDEKGTILLKHNPERAEKRFTPCSTYKIPHALMALETGKANGLDEAFAWDGTEYSIAAWNQDQTLETALQHSAVWVFDELYRRLGYRTERKFLKKLRYGNRKVKPKDGRFWLNGGLAISAREQVDMLRRLGEGESPFKDEHIAAVMSSLVKEKGDGWVLYGKTGSFQDENRYGLGWYVGYVETETGVRPFACNLEGQNVWGGDARIIVLQALRQHGVLEPAGSGPTPGEVVRRLRKALAEKDKESFLDLFSASATISIPDSPLGQGQTLSPASYWDWLQAKGEYPGFRQDHLGFEVVVWEQRGDGQSQSKPVRVRWRVQRGKLLSGAYF